MKAIIVLVVSLSLVSACADSGGTSGSVDVATSTSTTARAPSTSPVETSDTVSPSFDPDDAAWVIQQDAVVVVVGADGIGSFSPTADVPGDDQNNPDWSPDGSQVTFTVHDGRDDLWVVDVDGSDAHKIFDCESPCEFLDDPAWSPDGTSIAVCKMIETEDGHIGSLIRVDVEAGGETTLAAFAPEDFCAGPRWSPDGSEIVLELVHRPGTSLLDEPIGVTLAIVDLTADPSTITALTDSALFAATADWNRAGDLIVYSALATPDATAPDLFTIRPDGSALTRLTTLAEEGESAVEPTFDLDGSSVVFVDDAVGSLLRVDLATGETTAAFSTDLFGVHPRPRPIT